MEAYTNVKTEEHMARPVKNTVCEDLWSLMERRVQALVAPALWTKVLGQLDDRLWSTVDMPIADSISSQINGTLFPDE